MCKGLLGGKAGLLAGVAATIVTTVLSFPVIAGSLVFKEKLNDLGYTVVASEVENASKDPATKGEYVLSLHNEHGESVVKGNHLQSGPLSGLMLADVDGDGVREIIVSMDTDKVEQRIHFVDIFQFNGQNLTLIERNLAKINPTTHEIWLF
ncbi:MAG: hypothetical protein RI964_703 [Pseudomonadota bacterium]|jgi:hypothetical protein